MQVKAGIASRRIRSSLALEPYTARRHTRRAAPGRPGLRPQSQGASPLSDIGCEAATTLLWQYLERGGKDASGREAHDNLMHAAKLAGIAFGANRRARPPTA